MGWVTVKDTTSANSWAISDVLRGVNVELNADLANAEFTGSYVTAFDTDGFTVGTSSQFNQAGNNYIFMAIADPAQF